MKVNFNRLVLFVTPLFAQAAILFFYLRNAEISTYGSNDDALIASFSVDDDLGDDKNNWIFIKSLLSIPATFLQRVFPNLGIYGLLLGLTVIVSTSALYVLIDYVSNKFLKLIYIISITVIVIVFNAPALLNPTYTGAAIFAGASGFALIYFSVISDKVNSSDTLILSALLISLSYLIRAESFLLAFGFFLFIFIFHILFIRSIRVNYKNLKIPILTIIIIFFVNLGIDKVNYKSNEWQEYMSINELRHSIQLRSAEYYLQENLSEVDWSEEDFTMFRKFSMYDENFLNIDSLERAIEISSPTRGLSAVLNSNPKNELIFINYSYRTDHINVDMDWLLSIMIFLIFIFIVSLGKRSIYFLIYLFPIIFISIGINYIFAVSYHLPPRLTFNFLFLPAVGIIVAAIFQASKFTTLEKIYVFLTTFITILYIIITLSIFPDYLNKRVLINESHLDFFKKQSNDINLFVNTNPDATLIGTGSRIVYNLQSPYKPYLNISSSNSVLISGWHNLSPISKKKISQFGFSEEQFHKSILNEKNIYWIDDEGAKSLLEKYFQQHSTKEIVVEDLGFIGDPFYRIFRISETK